MTFCGWFHEACCTHCSFISRPAKMSETSFIDDGEPTVRVRTLLRAIRSLRRATSKVTKLVVGLFGSFPHCDEQENITVAGVTLFSQTDPARHQPPRLLHLLPHFFLLRNPVNWTLPWHCSIWNKRRSELIASAGTASRFRIYVSLLSCTVRLTTTADQHAKLAEMHDQFMASATTYCAVINSPLPCTIVVPKLEMSE